MSGSSLPESWPAAPAIYHFLESWSANNSSISPEECLKIIKCFAVYPRLCAPHENLQQVYRNICVNASGYYEILEYMLTTFPLESGLFANLFQLVASDEAGKRELKESTQEECNLLLLFLKLGAPVPDIKGFLKNSVPYTSQNSWEIVKLLCPKMKDNELVALIADSFYPTPICKAILIPEIHKRASSKLILEHCS